MVIRSVRLRKVTVMASRKIIYLKKNRVQKVVSSSRSWISLPFYEWLLCNNSLQKCQATVVKCPRFTQLPLFCNMISIICNRIDVIILHGILSLSNPVNCCGRVEIKSGQLIYCCCSLAAPWQSTAAHRSHVRRLKSG